MKNIMVSTEISIREAMALLDQTAEKVLLVVDAQKKLIGSLTDGDIRRHILSGYDISASIGNSYNKNPFFVFHDDFQMSRIKKSFTKNKINLIPILNENKQVVDYLTWEKVFGNNKNKKAPLKAPVVIMAGGKGSRLEPFTKVLPKPLIPVGDKTVIDHIIDRFCGHGIDEFYLTINYMAKIMRAYFEEKTSAYTVDFAQEREFRGTAASLELLKGKLNMPFFVSNCDIIIDADYSDIYRFHTEGNYKVTLVAATKQFNIPYGICELNGDGCLQCINEKPGYDFLVNTGLYVLSPEVLELIPEHGIFHMTSLIDKVKHKREAVGVYPISDDSWIDVGQWAEYRSALKLIESI